MFYPTFIHLIPVSVISVFVNLISATERNLEGRNQSYPPYTCYECFGSECNNPYNKTCDGALRCFTHTSLTDNMNILAEKGCHKVPFVMLAMCHDGKVKIELNETNDVTKCCVGNFCNDDKFIIPSIPDRSNSSGELNNEQIYTGDINSTGHFPYHIFISCALFIFVLVCLGTGCIFSTVRIAPGMKKQNLFPRFGQKPSVNPACDGFLSSGSGSGLPLLSQRSFVQDINLIECIGQGRFGEVWKGKMHSKMVAVKIFLSKDEASWKNEVNIYTSILLYHENVLRFKCSGIASRLGVTEMWLVTSFYERGSLYDYLLENTVTLKEMTEFLRSACCGLLHLHKESYAILGTRKPAIAHRDLKSRNILVSSQGTCVIADLGLAVMKGFNTSKTDEPINYLVGTKRYMAPEVLDESMNVHLFESFKRTDIYAFSLVVWEVCSRCVMDGVAEDYRPPFHNYVPNNPDFEDMKKVVCIELKRPEIPDWWSSNKTLDAMAELMNLCWHHKPEVRYTAYRLMKSLDRIQTRI